MPCYLPINAWRTTAGKVELGEYRSARDGPNAEQIQIPCGKCTGCIKRRAREWALRCHLELSQHDSAAFTTLTYDEENKPPTLSRRHLQLFYKRLRRANVALRHFTSGEYGTTTNRPHYHAILFGLGQQHASLIEIAWGLGHCRTHQVTQGAIAYVAGYTAKKITDVIQKQHERVDPTTGEVYQWEPPFIQMSSGGRGRNGIRTHGIGGHARQWPNSWKEYAVKDGYKVPVPRYLHESWKQQATPEEIHENLTNRRHNAKNNAKTKAQLIASEQNELVRQEHTNSKRRKYA